MATAPKPPPPPQLGGHYVKVGNNWQLIHATGPNQWAPGPVTGGTARAQIPIAPQPTLTPAQRNAVAASWGHPVTGPQSAPTYGAQSAVTPATPAAQPAAPAAAADQQQYPLDATYYGNVAQNQFNVTGKEQALGQQSAASTQALQTALGNLAYQQPRQQLSLEQGANRRGALYSSVYDQQAGDLATNFGNQRAAATTADASRQAAYTAQIKALQAGIPIYNDQQALASSLRQIAAAQKDPATGQDLSVGTTPAAIAAATMPPKPANPSSGGHYVNVNGKWQLIHAIGPGRWAPGPPPKK